jgi:hypothetical protein
MKDSLTTQAHVDFAMRSRSSRERFDESPAAKHVTAELLLAIPGPRMQEPTDRARVGDSAEVESTRRKSPAASISPGPRPP